MDRLTMTSDKGGLAFTFDLDVTCKRREMDKIVALGERLKAYEDVEEQRNKGCDFCCYADYPDGKLYPKVGYTFYAGFSQQVQVDEFHEEETEEINFCPMCGRKLKENT